MPMDQLINTECNVSPVKDELNITNNNLYNAYNPNNILKNITCSLYIEDYTNILFKDLPIRFDYIKSKLNYGISSSFVVAEAINFMLNSSFISADELAEKQYIHTKEYNSMDVLTCLQILLDKNISYQMRLKDKDKEYNDCICTSTHKNIDNLTYEQTDITNINLMKCMLTNNTPIICSIKVLPHLFNEQYNNDLYWDTAEVYYTAAADIYAISCMIIGCNETEFKLITYLTEVKYYNIPHCVFKKYNELFFNTYIITSDVSNENNVLDIFKKLKIVQSNSTSTNSLYSSEVSFESLDNIFEGGSDEILQITY